MIAAVVLAAGAATRFGSPKQRLMLDGILARLERSAVDHVVVVAGAYELEADAEIVLCNTWEEGPGASLRCGLEALGTGVEAAVVALADGPELSPEAVDRVIEAWQEGRGEVLAASYAGVRGHPVLLARAAWAGVPDEGGRALPAVLVPCDDLEPPGDVDYPGDLPEVLREEYGAPPASP